MIGVLWMIVLLLMMRMWLVRVKILLRLVLMRSIVVFWLCVLSRWVWILVIVVKLRLKYGLVVMSSVMLLCSLCVSIVCCMLFLESVLMGVLGLGVWML